MTKKLLTAIALVVLATIVLVVTYNVRSDSNQTASAAAEQATAEPTAVPTAEPTATDVAVATEQASVVPAVVAATATPAPEPVDDFTVTLVNGETFTLSDYRGKIVVVDLWATWCPPCVASMPYLQQLSEEYADQVVILGVNCGDSADTVASFVEKYGYTFPIAVDENLDILYNHFYTSGIPYTVFIDANGELYDTHLGGGDDVYRELKAMIDGALAKTPVESN